MGTHERARTATSLAALLMLAAPTYAHQPHDRAVAVALSPDFATDGIVFSAAAVAKQPHPVAMLRSHDGGRIWKRVVDGIDVRGSFTSIAISPDFTSDGTVFAATDDSGIYLSTDHGISWRSILPGFKSNEFKVSACAIDGAGALVYLVAGNSGAMGRTATLGAHWKRVLATTTEIEAIAFSPTFASDDTVFAGDVQGNVLASVDGGLTWTVARTLPSSGTIHAIALAPDFVSGGDGFFATHSGGIYKSDDGGATFSQSIVGLPSEPIAALAISPDYLTDRTLFAATTTQAVLRSVDGGGSWQLHAVGAELDANTSEHFFQLAVSKGFAVDGSVWLVTQEGLFHSDDRGLTWAQAETMPQSSILGLDVAPAGNGATAVALNKYGSGVSLSPDGGDSWKVVNTGLMNPFVYDLTMSPDFATDATMFCIHADRVLRTVDGGGHWVASNDDVGSFPNVVEISPTFAQDRTVFTGSRFDGLFRSVDGGGSWRRVYYDGPHRFDSIAFSSDFAHDGTVFAARKTDGVLRSTDGGATWKEVNTGLAIQEVRGPLLKLSPDFPNDRMLLAATLEGLFRSVNAGATWRVVSVANLPLDAPFETVHVSPDFVNDGTLFACARGRGLYRSRDGGVSWQAVGSKLLQHGAEFNEIAFSPGFATDHTLLGTSDADLFRSVDGGDTWKPETQGPVRHEDDKPESQWVSFEGSWGTFDYAEASESHFHYTAASGAAARFVFNGTAVRWVGARAPLLGIAEIYLDGAYVGDADQYDPDFLAGATLFQRTGLPDVRHELRVVVTSRKNPLATGTGVAVDAFDLIKPSWRD